MSTTQSVGRAANNLSTRMRQQLDRMYISMWDLNPHLLLALALVLAFHGGLLLSGTFKRTYDAYIHIFFGDHYRRAWFDHWEYRWYTGFPMVSYPPGSQQSIALLSFAVGLLNGFIITQLFALFMVVIGIYRFSKIWVSEEAAGYAALLAVFASSINETVHVFGQLPTTFSLGFLLNALPYAYRWIRDGDPRILIIAWIVNAATTAGHHVTTLFGAVFFAGPVIVLAIVEKFREPLPDEPRAHPTVVTRENIKPLIIRRLRRIIPATLRSGIYGGGLIPILLIVVLPYWIWSRVDPINQVPIPHASRDNFLENTAAGLVFWLVPYGTTLIALPYVFYKGFTTRAWPMALSLWLLFILGTGGTTPIPRLILRGAFDILTLDRFTFWATILMLPLLGEFVVSLRHRGLAKYLREQFGDLTWRLVQAALVVAYLGFAIFTANLTQFRKFQPAAIDMAPIVNFLEKDEHWRWRYITLGFGDQMAWLSAQTTATSVDGNYHSARRLPELTTTPVERLEGAKYSGIPGIGSLQQFLAVPDKYNLKFVFSNDQFYDPLLYFSGWHRIQRLENGIMVWERGDIPPLPEVLPRKEIPMYQRIMWGTIPMGMIFLSFFAMTAFMWGPPLRRLLDEMGAIALAARFWRLGVRLWLALPGVPKRNVLCDWWRRFDDWLLRHSYLPTEDDSPEIPWQVWMTWLQRIPRPKPAPPSAHQVRLTLLVCLVLAGALLGYRSYRNRINDPLRIVEAYYDDLDFRRFGDAYERLDPETRPSYEQYRLELSVVGGLLASYAKLDSVYTSFVRQEPDRVVVRADTIWITALQEYRTTQTHTLVKRNGKWYLLFSKSDIRIPPDQFFRQPSVAWGSQQRRRVTDRTTAFADILDRPELQILSARLVKVNDRYSVVGELINTDVDPADLTVTSYLFDEDNNELTWYNAQYAIIHKILPKEVTPFRIDFEGVAGMRIEERQPGALEFDPNAFTPPDIRAPIANFEVYAKALVTGRDLYRGVGVQDVQVVQEDGAYRLQGELINNGTLEATIPHLLITYYDERNQVVWVDHFYQSESIRPQRTQRFDVPITPAADVETILDKGDIFANILREETSFEADWSERIILPPDLQEALGYHSIRVTVHSFVGASF